MAQFKMRNFVAAAVMLIANSALISAANAQQNDPYVAKISCLVNGQASNVVVCFLKTDLKIKSHGGVQIYKAHNLSGAGQVINNVLNVSLSENFEVTAQNSYEHGILDVEIVQKSTGKSVFQDQASRFGVVKVGN